MAKSTDSLQNQVVDSSLRLENALDELGVLEELANVELADTAIAHKVWYKLDMPPYVI